MDEAMRQKIAQRAYELFLQRSGVHGYHMEDWVKAEKEILGAAQQPGATTVPKRPAVAQQPSATAAPKKPAAARSKKPL